MGKVLASISAGLLVILLLVVVAWSQPPSGSAPDGVDDGRNLSSEVARLSAAQPIEAFAVITERPVFNESRQPEIAAGEDDGTGQDGPIENVNVGAPDVELAGVVITPDVRVVTLRQKEGNESLLAYEGQPLEGNFGSWQVSRIEPRNVVLQNDDGEEIRLELQVHDAVIKEPPKPAVQPDQDQPPAEAAAGDEPPVSRAEEIRQRIQERREELRRAAEERGDEQASRPGDYRSAIQQMMNRRNNQASDENDQ